MTLKRRDVSAPPGERRSGESGGETLYDLEETTGDELVAQRIVRGFTTAPGDLHHRPEWGAGLQRYSNEPPTLTNQQQLLKDAERFLETLEFVDDYQVIVSEYEGDEGTHLVESKVQSRGERLELPEVII
jgi:phage baseplate assembly protein W